MDLSERIERRQMRTRDDRLLLDRALLSPTVHFEEPVGRAPALESLLDAVAPVFEGQLPPTLAVTGPAGVGKSAVVGSLFGALDQRLGVGGSIATTTRGGSPQRWFATVDCRHAPTPFRFYRQLLCQFEDAEVPAHGVGTERLESQVIDHLSPQGRWAVIAVDHVDDAPELDAAGVRNLLDPVADSVSLTWVGRDPPIDPDRTVHIEPYRHHALTDVLAHRCSRAASTDAFDHDDLRTIAARREGNAHDALAVALGAALLAEAADDPAVDREHLTAASAAVPEDTVHLDAVLALPENRRRVLAALLKLDPAPTVGEAAREIADRTDLTAGTVRRFCYELSDAGILARHGGDADARGRDPSHLTPAFPWLAFAGIDDVLSVEEVRDRVEREAATVAAW